MSSFEFQEKNDQREGDELFSIPIKAGKRIYYFDVKSTRNNDYYLTITESRKRPMRDGSFVIDRHKIHLYKEDFEKFASGLEEVLNYIKANRPEEVQSNEVTPEIPTEEEFFKDL